MFNTMKQRKGTESRRTTPPLPMLGYARFCSVLLGYARLCPGMLRYALVCSGMLRYGPDLTLDRRSLTLSAILHYAIYRFVSWHLYGSLDPLLVSIGVLGSV